MREAQEHDDAADSEQLEVLVERVDGGARVDDEVARVRSSLHKFHHKRRRQACLCSATWDERVRGTAHTRLG